MRRPVVAGAAAIAGLGVASVGLVLWATSLGRPAPAPDGAAAPQAAPGRLAPAPAPPALPTEALALRNPRSALAPPEERAWEQLRPLARPIAPLVRALEGPVAPCFEEETQARFGPLPHTSLSDASADPSGPATLMLQLEAVEGGLRVVDAPVARQGAAEDGLVACAQRALRGRTFPLPHLAYAPGERLTMAYPLRPPAAPAASAAVVAPASATSTAPGAARAPPFKRQRGKTGPAVP